MLQLHQRTSAPSAVNVSISTAVWIVMCREPVMRAPFSGCASVYSARIAIRPGISCSASVISLRPNSASERSATLKSVLSVAAGVIADMTKPPVRSGERPCCRGGEAERGGFQPVAALLGRLGRYHTPSAASAFGQRGLELVDQLDRAGVDAAQGGEVDRHE